MPEPNSRDAFVKKLVAQFDGRSREVAEAQLAQASGDAREAWAAVIAALDAQDLHPGSKPD